MDRIVSYEITNSLISNTLKYCICNTYACLSVLGYRIYDTRYVARKNRVVISEDLQVAYVVNPLAASRSFLEVLLHGTNDLSFSLIKGFAKADIVRLKNDNDWLTFTVSRNPWDRLVSCYNKKILNANNLKKIAILSQFRGLYPQMPFGEFVRWLTTGEGRDENSDPHWVTQQRILTDDEGDLICDTVLRLNNLDREFAVLAERIGLGRSELPSRASSGDQVYDSIFSDYRKYYYSLDKDIISKIAKRYRPDCVTFGYPVLKEYMEC